MLVLIASLTLASWLGTVANVPRRAACHISMASQAEPSVEELQAEIRDMRSNLRAAMAAGGAAELRANLLQQELSQLKSKANSEFAGGEAKSTSDDSRVSMVFDAVDEDGNGVLDIAEFRKGYAMLTGDVVQAAFEAIDNNNDGVLTKEEFSKGFALLTSDSARAAAERTRTQSAVEAERVRAVKEAAKNLAEAQLMDTLYRPSGKKLFPAQYKPVPGRKPLPKPGLRAMTSVPLSNPAPGKAPGLQ
jgi:Ca2+-binding EF-hand superfamily protein